MQKKLACDTYPTPLANLTLIILFSGMLKFSKIISSKSKNIVKDNSENLRIFHLLKLIFSKLISYSTDICWNGQGTMVFHDWSCFPLLEPLWKFTYYIIKNWPSIYGERTVQKDVKNLHDISSLVLFSPSWTIVKTHILWINIYFPPIERVCGHCTHEFHNHYLRILSNLRIL
jgi:hypothetical protein